MSGNMGQWEAGEGAENSYKRPAVGAPPGSYGAAPPPSSAAGAPPGSYGAPPPRSPAGAPPRYGARPPPRYGARPPSLAAVGQPGYVAPPGNAQRQAYNAQPQAQYAAGGYNAYPQQQQMPAPNVIYGVHPPPTMSYSAQVQQQQVRTPPMQQEVVPVGQWTTGLFDMDKDPENCLVTCFLPCITFGQIAEVVDEGTTSCLLGSFVWLAAYFCCGLPCLVSCFWRTKLRAKYNIPADEIEDVCVHFWCEPCALCQEFRELKNRGLDPSLGWEYHHRQLHPQPAMGAPPQVNMQR